MIDQKIDGREEILLKSVAESGPLLVEIRDSFVDLVFGRFEKSRSDHFLRARSLANTSSAGTASILPALYSAYRRSAS